jgi:RNA polymerase sigma-70 factor (ECF subfamily)
VELDDVFRAYERRIYAYFLRLVRDALDAEELTQETFVSACGAAVRFRGDSDVSTWLFGIARRVLLEAARGGLFDRADASEQESPQEDPEERMDLQRAFDALSLADREVLMFVDVLGFTPSETAAMVGVTPEALRVRLHRARGRLRARYTR